MKFLLAVALPFRTPMTSVWNPARAPSSAAAEMIATQLRRLNALRAIDEAILGTVDLQLALKTILEETRLQLGLSRRVKKQLGNRGGL